MVARREYILNVYMRAYMLLCWFEWGICVCIHSDARAATVDNYKWSR